MVQVVGVSGSPVNVQAEGEVGGHAPSIYTPVYQTEDNNGSLGDGGVAAGSWWKSSGNILNMTGTFSFTDPNVNPGTGAVLIPFPPGFTADDVDVERMPRVEDSVGPPHVIGALMQIFVTAKIGGSDIVDPATCLIETSDGVIQSAGWDFENRADIVTGDSVSFRFELPLK